MHSVAFASLAFASSAAQAQTQEDGARSAQGEAEAKEIIVTAQFRSQKLQDTPLSITALDASAMAERGQTNIIDVAKQTPSLTLEAGPANQGQTVIAFIRGVGQGDQGFAFEPGVGVYVDDVYLGTLIGSQLQLLDLDRIEVLRGPQGTLSGKNSIGGSLKLFSKKPTGEPGGYLEASMGSYNKIGLRGSADFSIVPDRVFARLSGAAMKRKGFMKLIDYGCTHPGSGVETFGGAEGCGRGTEGGEEFVTARLAVRALVTDNVEINLTGEYLDDGSETPPEKLIAVNPNVVLVPPLINTKTGQSTPYDGRFLTNGNSSYASYCNPASITGPYCLEPKDAIKQWGTSATIDWTLSDKVSFKSITAYRAYVHHLHFDNDGSPLNGTLAINRNQHDQFSQELRLNAALLDDAVDLTVGGFYFEQWNKFSARADAGYGGFDILLAADAPSTSKSAFAHAIWHLTPTINIGGGLRYTQERKDYGFYGYRNSDGTPNPLFAGVNGVTGKFSDNRLDYRAVADWRVSDQAMVYAQFSTGYKGGGINPRPYVPTQVQPFGPESMTAYEIGVKSDLFDRRLRLNVSGFLNEYKGIQLNLIRCDEFSPFPGFPCLIPANAGNARIKGIEMEASLRLGAFTMDASGSWLDFKYKNLNPFVIAGGTTLDMVTPYTPKWKGSVGAQYRFDVLGGGLTPRLDWNYRSTVYADGVNAATNRLAGRSLWDAHLMWNSAGEEWRLSLDVTNLSDKKYYVSLFDTYNSSGFLNGRPGRPREWSVTLARKF
ncbi:MAG: TonB-dependent receptor [Novosphingobium sp.]|nr:TonB-dependent receptor [Novosphingobium sp.]